jgi:hypothetical protein
MAADRARGSAYHYPHKLDHIYYLYSSVVSRRCFWRPGRIAQRAGKTFVVHSGTVPRKQCPERLRRSSNAREDTGSWGDYGEKRACMRHIAVAEESISWRTWCHCDLRRLRARGACM